MVVIDTNVLAYLLIEGDRTADAQALHARDPDWRSEGFLLVEFSNIVATYLRAGSLDSGAAGRLLASAEQILSGSLNLPHSHALAIAAEFGVSAYDARFLGAARGLRAKLVTEDAKLRRAAPGLTRSLSQALAVA
jgi:predicted nucleic acid-binding protein